MRSSVFLVAVLLCGLVSAQPMGGDLPQKVAELEKAVEKQGQTVAFSAALVDSTEWTTKEASGGDLTLEYKKVITNLGNGYDPQTGFFTAPVKGLYYIQATGVAGPSGELHAGMKKNGEVVFALYQKAGTQVGASNGVTLALEQGDRLCVQLWQGKTIADQGRLSIFSGFLINPM